MRIEFKDGLWYFAHPYTCKLPSGTYVPGGEEANFHLCNIRAARLIEKGYLVYSPISHTHAIHMAYPPFVGQQIHDMWYEFDNKFIEQTPFKGIILAPGWLDSTGCCNEERLFVDLGREVIHYEEIVTEV